MSIRKSSALALCLLVSKAALAQPAAPPPPPPPGAVPAPPAADAPTIDLREAPDVKLSSGREALRVQAGGLTSQEVARRAVATSVQVESKRADIEAAAAKVDQALVAFLPRVSLSATYRRTMQVKNSLGSGALLGARNPGLLGMGSNCQLDESVPAPPECLVDAAGEPVVAVPFDLPVVLNYYTLEASLSVPLSDYVLRFSNAVKGAKSSEEAARLSVQAEALKAANDAKIAYYNWTRSVAAGAVTEASLERTKALLEDARGSFGVGMATKADVMRLEALVASTQYAIQEAKTMRGLAEEQLGVIMGLPTREYQVGEDVLTPTLPPPVKPTEELVEEAYRKRIELKVVQEAVRSFERGIRALNVGRYPRLDAFGNYTYANPNQLYFASQPSWKPSWYAGLSLTYSPNDTLATGAAAREYKAQLAKLRADEKALRLGLRMEVASAELEWQKAQANLESATRAYEAAREAYRVARDLYQVGRATTTDLIAAESELVLAELQQVNAAIDARVAAVKLQHATGRDVTR